jgi:hypothetical protein
MSSVIRPTIVTVRLAENRQARPLIRLVALSEPLHGRSYRVQAISELAFQVSFDALRVDHLGLLYDD